VQRRGALGDLLRVLVDDSLLDERGADVLGRVLKGGLVWPGPDSGRQLMRLTKGRPHGVTAQ
jgi:hypothetical protein